MSSANSQIAYFYRDGRPTPEGQKLIAALNSAGVANAEGLASLTTTVAGLVSTVSTLSTTVAANTSAAAALTTRVEALEAKLAAIAAVTGPSGGVTNDLQARTAINGILAAAA